MKKVIAPVLVALLLAAAGGYAWMRGEGGKRLAAGRQALATMQFDSAMPTAGDQASANYWLAKYDALTQEHDASGVVVEQDPDVLLVAANGAYRALDRTTADRQVLVPAPNRIIKSYAEVMKAENSPEDAAYNYE